MSLCTFYCQCRLQPAALRPRPRDKLNKYSGPYVMRRATLVVLPFIPFPLRALHMASVASLTRQLSGLELSNKPSSTARPTHSKQPSGSGQKVAGLRSKFSAPSAPGSAQSKSKLTSSALRNQTNINTEKPQPEPQQKAQEKPPSPSSQINIGDYDGGLELDNEKKDEDITGDAAEELALDSSTARYVRLSRRYPIY